METAATLIHKYAAEARRIYADQTQGDFTWEGLLFSFLRDVADAGIDIKNEIPPR